MKRLTNLLAILTAGAFAMASFSTQAQESTPAKKKGDAFAGVVTAVDPTAKTVTVSNKKKDKVLTFTITEETKFEGADGAEAEIAIVIVGARVRVNPTDAGDAATKVKVLGEKKKKEAADGAKE